MSFDGNIVEYVPIPVFVADYSANKKWLDQLHLPDGEDIAEYLTKNPHVVDEQFQLFKIIDINLALLKLVRLKSSEEFFAHWRDLCSPKTIETYKNTLIAICHGETYMEFETEVLTIDQYTLATIFRLQIYPGYEHNYARMIITIFDSTELKEIYGQFGSQSRQQVKQLEKKNQELLNEINMRQKIEKELHTASKRFHDIALSSADWLWEVDENGRYIYASGQVEQFLGYSIKELIGKTPFDFMHKEEAERVNKIFQAITAKKQPIIDLENWNITKSGEKICLLTNGVPVLDKKGNLLSYRGVDKNITSRKMAENALRASEKRYQTLAALYPVGILHVNSENKFTYVNKKCCEITGRDAETLLEHGLFIAIHPDDQDHCQKKWMAACERLQTADTSTMECRMQQPDGSIVWVLGRLALARDERGVANGFIGTITDVTELRQAEERLRLQQRQLKQIKHLNSMGELTSGLAHQLNQPLAVISSYAQECQRRLNASQHLHSPDVVEAMKKIELHAVRAGEIINRLHSFFGIKQLHKQPENINTVIQNTIYFLEQDFFNIKSIVLELDEALPLVTCDRVQIEQVIFNLVQNAIESVQGQDVESAKITIKTSHTKSNVIVNICDTGPEISEEIKEYIFDMFFTTKHDGLGLGLAICRSIIEAHDGRIGVRGKALQFDLPL
ncbi:MAG: PAS domain S-box protein [Gammaproteobacteria bacterium]|nr:PAS domain S-box protein [Gammaproteobacteria bacterium]